jgi:hypothetical protein
MKLKLSWIRNAVLALPLLAANLAWGQAFSSGSTGADGPLTVSGTVNITVRPGGVYNYTTVTINNFSTLNFVKGADNSPVVVLATGDVNIGGSATISVNGNPNAGGSPAIGGNGGPGGFAGGNAGAFGAGSLGSPGHGPGGGQPTSGTPAAGQRGTYGAPNEFVALIPLLGGSGGSGGGGNGNAGAGGGGAILIASSTRISFGNASSQIRANGGDGTGGGCSTLSGAPGSGGAIRLVAPQIVGPGQLRALGGNACVGSGVAGGDGRIRLEASVMDFTGNAFPVPSVSLSPGPASPVGSPALGAVPTLAITSIGGQSLPAVTSASYFVPDLTLPLGTTNPVPVAITATNTPVGAPTAISVRLIPQTGSWTDVAVANQTGTFASSSGSADITFPVGRVSVVQAIAALTLTGQTASLFPLIDGVPVERVLVAASPGVASTLTLVTKSGREVPLDELRAEQQLQVARAWQILKETHVE